MDTAAIQDAVARMAEEIVRSNPNGVDLLLIGIQTGGVQLARQLREHLARRGATPADVGQLDVSMHRDDLDERPAPRVHPTSIPFDISGKNVVLVDDVLFSGRTTRAALDALHDLGRPRRIQLAVLVDRGHRELPIEADFVGATIVTAPEDRVNVELGGADENKVILEKAGAR